MGYGVDIDNKVSLVELALGGRTDGLAKHFSVDDIKAVLSAQPIVTYAAAILVGSLIARWSTKVDFKSGATSRSNSQKIPQLEKLRDMLMAAPGDFIGGGDGSGVPNIDIFVGGTSKSEMQALAQDGDLVQPSFRIGQFDEEGVGVYDPEARDDECC